MIITETKDKEDSCQLKNFDDKIQYLDYQMILGEQEEQNTCFFQLKECEASLSIWSPK